MLIPQAAAMLDTTTRNIWTKLREGRLVAVKDGRRTFVTVESIKAHAASLPRAMFTPLVSKEIAQRLLPTNMSILSDDEIAEIVKDTTHSQEELAALHGVTQSTIARLKQINLKRAAK